MTGSKAMALGEAARQAERWGLQGSGLAAADHCSTGGRGSAGQLQQEGSFCFFEKMLSEVTRVLCTELIRIVTCSTVLLLKQQLQQRALSFHFERAFIMQI